MKSTFEKSNETKLVLFVYVKNQLFYEFYASKLKTNFSYKMI